MRWNMKLITASKEFFQIMTWQGFPNIFRSSWLLNSRCYHAKLYIWSTCYPLVSHRVSLSLLCVFSIWTISKFICNVKIIVIYFWWNFIIRHIFQNFINVSFWKVLPNKFLCPTLHVFIPFVEFFLEFSTVSYFALNFRWSIFLSIRIIFLKAR